jgi:hypothetical protein
MGHPAVGGASEMRGSLHARRTVGLFAASVEMTFLFKVEVEGKPFAPGGANTPRSTPANKRRSLGTPACDDKAVARMGHPVLGGASEMRGPPLRSGR